MHVRDLKANTIHARCGRCHTGALPSMITACAIRVYTRQTFIASEGINGVAAVNYQGLALPSPGHLCTKSVNW